MKFAYPEILATLLLFPQGLSSGVFTNLLMESLCMRVANMTHDVCSHVELIPSDVQSIIQPQVNRLLNWKVLIETFLPALCVVFLGPWSDAHGRRPLILISLLGQSLYFTILTVLVFFKDSLPAEYYLLAAVPVGISGGFSVFFLSVVCFITDCTTDKNRAFKMGTFEAGCMLGSLIAQLLTAKVSRGPHGFQITFMISSLVCFINLLYAIIFIPESANLSQEVQQVHLLDLFKAFSKKRPMHRRAILYLLILANTSFIIIVFGESDIFYQSAIKRFQWSLQQFSNLNSVSLVVSGSVLVVGTQILKCIGLTDATAALIVVAPRIFSSLMIFYAPTDRWLYAAAALGCISTLITPFYRTAVSNIIPSDELGKVFAVIMFTEALVPID
ncbi:proton-coupled folate transporter isoform X2 [Nilaparvata lugens]|nr:proton-coupled folate transporter isoform X2 [Nilaparvata lugens]XP_039277078.1 proton-coupled folate transporter isoform X2 [Nilaparvata lugens]